jgi:hypothetical protein
MKYIVYMTVNTVNRKIYVGVHKINTSNFDGYIGCGIRSEATANKDLLFHKAVRKYGYNKFKRYTIAEFDNANDAFHLEREIVTEQFVKSKNTYNTAIGGVCSAGKTNEKKIIQYSLSGKFIKVWNSISEAATYFSISPGTLRQALVPPFKSRVGHQWRYWAEEFPTYIGYYSTKLRIAQYDTEGNLVKVWDSKKKAAISLGKKNDSALDKYAKNHKLYCGYQWRIIKNNEEVPDYIEKYIDPNIVLQLDKDTSSIIKEWNKQELYKTSKFRNVKDALNGRVKTYKGFRWMYKKDYINYKS